MKLLLVLLFVIATAAMLVVRANDRDRTNAMASVVKECKGMATFRVISGVLFDTVETSCSWAVSK
jgi:hypothetical protein